MVQRHKAREQLWYTQCSEEVQGKNLRVLQETSWRIGCLGSPATRQSSVRTHKLHTGPYYPTSVNWRLGLMGLECKYGLPQSWSALPSMQTNASGFERYQAGAKRVLSEYPSRMKVLVTEMAEVWACGKRRTVETGESARWPLSWLPRAAEPLL